MDDKGRNLEKKGWTACMNTNVVRRMLRNIGWLICKRKIQLNLQNYDAFDVQQMKHEKPKSSWQRWKYIVCILPA